MSTPASHKRSRRTDGDADPQHRRGWHRRRRPGPRRSSGSGPFAPLIAQWLVQKFHTTNAVSAYLLIFTLIAFATSFTMKDRTGKPIDKDAMDIPGAQELAGALRR